MTVQAIKFAFERETKEKAKNQKTDFSVWPQLDNLPFSDKMTSQNCQKEFGKSFAGVDKIKSRRKIKL